MVAPFPSRPERVSGSGSVLAGDWREPRNMLAGQTYDEHASIHDDETARKLGFAGGTIEGPTHFSQFAPIGYALWGPSWFEHGAISMHYRNAAFEGEPVRALAEPPAEGGRTAHAWMTKQDGAEVLRGTLSLGPDHPPTALDRRLAGLERPEKLVILRDVQVGAVSARRPVVMTADQRMGELYPFSLRQKLEHITEPCSWYGPDEPCGNPWGRPIIPFEMISVLSQYLAAEDPFPVRGPVVGLFADQEIRLHGVPLFVGHPYEITREVVALSASRRTESVWIRTLVFEPGAAQPVATLLLNQAYMKESFAGYAAEAGE